MQTERVRDSKHSSQGPRVEIAPAAQSLETTHVRRDVRVSGNGATPVDETGSGWLTFAGIILIFEGVMRFFDAIWAFRFDGPLPDGLQDATFGDSLTTYGWVYLIVGLILVLAGIGVLYRNQFSRWIGIIAAAIGGLSAMAWLPYYPIWSLIYILIALAVFLALAAYGGRDTVVS
jgi:hypothetical protein